MSRVTKETELLLTYKFRAYPPALLEYRMENQIYMLCNLYNHAIEERKRVAKIHENVRNARRGFLCKLSRYLVSNCDHISFENLNIKGLVQSSSSAKLIAERLHECPECGTVMEKKDLACLRSVKIKTTRTYVCGGNEEPQPMQGSPCGSSGWGKIHYRKFLR